MQSTKQRQLQAVSGIDPAKYGFHDDIKPVYETDYGLTEDVVKDISGRKGEPKWMLDIRLKALKHFLRRPTPTWGGNLAAIDFDKIKYYVKPSDKSENSWDDVPDAIKKTFDRLGIPEAERKFLGGVGAQYDSEVVYHKLREDLKKLGIVFLGMDDGLKEYPEIVKKYFTTVIPYNDNKYAALNTAVWSGGSFVYIPKGVDVKIPLQAYFRINTEKAGQFERTLIIAEPGAKVHYIEGCTAPVYATDSLHSAVVELIALEGSKIRYTTIQNWSKNVFNLVTKRAFAYKNSTVEWVDGNLGCLTGDTKIFLNNEVKDIEEAAPNDIIFSMNENFELVRARVLAKKFSGRKEIFKLRTLNHREISATANHPFLALKKIGKQRLIKWVPLEQLKSGDLVAISGKIPDHGNPYKIKFAQREGKNAPRKIKVPIDSDKNLMWLFGFYLGDGYFDKNRVYFAVPPQDKSYPKVKDLIESIFGAQAVPYKSTLRVNSVALIQLVKELGFAGNARTKRVPKWVFTLPEGQKRSFIDGYIAADGHIRKNHKNVSITSCSRELLEQIKTLSISCGLNPMKISKWSRVEKKKLGKETKEYTHYFLYFGESEMQTPVQFIPIAEIISNGYADTYDIEIEGTHNFVANGFLVHNSKLTMKYPAVYLKEPGAKAEILSVAFAGKDQHQDAGGKVVHMAPNTTSTITSKSISKDNGRTTYRGLVKVYPNATNVRSHVKCDALMLDKDSRSDTIPYMEIDEKRGVTIAHEATVGKISEEHLFYLMSRGLNEQEAMTMVVMGFFQAFVKELPLDYAVELNKLIQMEMEGAIG